MDNNLNIDEVCCIIDYLKELYTENYKKSADNYFMTEGSYIFAIVMKKIIPDIVIMDNEKHVVFKLNEQIYDASGVKNLKDIERENYVVTNDEGFLYLELALYPNHYETEHLIQYLIENGSFIMTKINKKKQKTKRKRLINLLIF